MKIYIESHGCSRRKLDVAKFHRYFAVNGYTVVKDPALADEILITTCAFKYDEEEESMRAIENMGKYSARITIYGCLPAISPAKYSKYNYDYITPKDINSIDDHFENITRKFSDIDDENIIDGEINYSSLPEAIEKFTSNFEMSIPFFLKSCRYVKNKYLNRDDNYYLFTSRGCLGNCSYCGVRFAVGSLVSKPLDAVAREFSKGIQSGYKTYTVIGDDVGGYGHDCGSDFCTLLSTLQHEIDKLPARPLRERIGLHVEEINPRWILRYGNELVNLFASTNVKSILCPIQSGSPRILGLMNRNDDMGALMTLLNALKARNISLELNTQIIVGFPTETEEEFEESLEQLAKVAFSSVTLFPYDDKENTPSYDMYPKIPEQVKQERIKKAHVFLRSKGIKSALCCNE